MSLPLFALAAVALLLWLLLRRPGQGLQGEVVYQDVAGERAMVSHRYGLVGRPDYITRDRGAVVPVEVKSRACGSRGPYPGERAQLLAYCLLAEQEYGETVRYGVLQYRDRSVTVPFGDDERQEIVALVQEMHSTIEADRSHNQPPRCRRCGFRDRCDQRLA